ncbi:MAG: universal stress protein [Arenibacter sp.]|nr:universal stress protein [Arenibacter sp.]
MTRRILCPTDFSKNAQNAINYAVELFKDKTCVFYILNTYDVASYSMEITSAGDLEASRKKSIGGLKITSELLPNDNQNHKFRTIFQCGNLIDTMRNIIDEQDIDMVVMGTKGATNSGQKAYGSQTVLAMEEIRNCPVLAVPEKTIYKEIREIVFPTNYRTIYKRREFQYLVDIANISNASIKVVKVFKKEGDLDSDQINNQNLLKDYFEGLDYSFHSLYNNEVQTAINEFIRSRGSDMVAFINKKHSFFSMMLSRPMVKNLGYYADIPVLALHDYRRR